MKKYSGLNLTEKEKKQIEKDVEKLVKFYKEEPDISIKLEKAQDGTVKATMKTIYCGVPVYVSEEDDNKISATKKAVDVAVRKFRKIKTDIIDKNRYSNSIVDDKRQETNKKQLKHSAIDKLTVYTMTQEEAFDILEGEGLDIIAFQNKNNIYILVRQDEYKKIYVLEN